ncbi:MAG: hypothetical protein V4757_11185 [Pseudomonadota bacterium]
MRFKEFSKKLCFFAGCLKALLVGALLLGASQTMAAIPLLDEMESLVKKEGGFLKSLQLESIQEIKSLDSAGRRVDGWRLGQLLGGLVLEVEQEVVSNRLSALDKIDLGLRLANGWRDRFDNWNVLVLQSEGELLMARWFLRSDENDLIHAREKFSKVDDQHTTAEKGRGVYSFGARFGLLANWAADMKRPREEQILLILTGINVTKSGLKQYPYDSTTGVSTLYRQLHHVSGGSALSEYLDEWITFIEAQSEKAQNESARMLSSSLFMHQRDRDAIKWFNRYAHHAAHDKVPSHLVVNRPGYQGGSLG